MALRLARSSRSTRTVHWCAGSTALIRRVSGCSSQATKGARAAVANNEHDDCTRRPCGYCSATGPSLPRLQKPSRRLFMHSALRYSSRFSDRALCPIQRALTRSSTCLVAVWYSRSRLFLVAVKATRRFASALGLRAPAVATAGAGARLRLVG